MTLPTDRLPHSYDMALAHLQRAKVVVDAAAPHHKYPQGHTHLARYIQLAMEAISPWRGPGGLSREQVEADLKHARARVSHCLHDCRVLVPLLPMKDADRVKTLLKRAASEVFDPYDMYPTEEPTND